MWLSKSPVKFIFLFFCIISSSYACPSLSRLFLDQMRPTKLISICSVDGSVSVGRPCSDASYVLRFLNCTLYCVCMPFFSYMLFRCYGILLMTLCQGQSVRKPYHHLKRKKQSRRSPSMFLNDALLFVNK